MRVSSLGLLALLPALSNAAIAGIAGMIDNHVEAAQLQGAAELLSGNFMVRNVATGQVLTYGREGNHITPGGAGTPVTVLQHGHGTSWARLQIGDKNKCLSSQWGGSYNHAGVMYHCAVDVGGEVTRLENTLEPTKQWWLIVPVSSYSDAGNHDNAALVAAQQLSVKTREKAMGISKRAQGFGVLESSVTRRHADADLEKRALTAGWRERILAARKKHVASRQAVKATSKSVAKPKAAVKIPVQSESSDINKGVSLNVKPATKPAVVEVEAEEPAPAPVPVGDRFFIIPTDHLLDMHTLALTGHQIESAGNTQSTALDAWNPSDAEQQWIFTRI